jgi:hypothetical protein
LLRLTILHLISLPKVLLSMLPELSRLLHWRLLLSVLWLRLHRRLLLSVLWLRLHRRLLLSVLWLRLHRRLLLSVLRLLLHRRLSLTIRLLHIRLLRLSVLTTPVSVVIAGNYH